MSKSERLVDREAILHEIFGRFLEGQKRSTGRGRGQMGCVRGSAWCDLGRLLGHVLGRGARRTPILQCQIERRGGASRRLFWEVEKATRRSCIARYVTPADRGRKHVSPCLWSINGKSPKIALMTIIEWGGGFFGRSGLRSGSRVEGLVFGSAVLGLRSEVFWSWVEVCY